MTPEEAYEEALRRIREAASLTSLQSLILSDCGQLSGLIPAGRSHFASIAQTIRVLPAQRFIPTGKSHLAPIAHPLGVQVAA
jgi:hypothetical protein